jgi:ElaB/YqjD/DUF883 family membrane-anchored ribosome-binding protein
MNSPAPSSPLQPVTETLQSARDNVLKAAEQLRGVAAQKAADLKAGAAHLRDEVSVRGEDIAGLAGDALKQALDQYEQLMKQAEKATIEKPRQALYTAFGVGLVIGLILRR